ncbi:MAG TPA: SOS response-associated peptidase [Lacunisphaera sp.]|jgi:putative SOS response-associated peptidase YedK|nr:SOS response-associated peptidase [Lacunisphaera sp.]
MCVRYTLHKTDAALAAIARALGRHLDPPEWVQPKFNIAPTHIVPGVTLQAAGPEVRGFFWGFVPFYERDKPQPRMLTNAQSEKAAVSPAFRDAIARRRCLIPVNGFYEWETRGKLKLPHLFTLRDEEPFAFAGIWEPGPDPELPPGFTILTTTPNELVGRYHNRMPVMLAGDALPRWLGGEGPLPADEYQALTAPLAPERMQERPVNRFVNNARNEGPQCLAPPEEAPPELELPLG